MSRLRRDQYLLFDDEQLLAPAGEAPEPEPEAEPEPELGAVTTRGRGWQPPPAPAPAPPRRPLRPVYLIGSAEIEIAAAAAYRLPMRCAGELPLAAGGEAAAHRSWLAGGAAIMGIAALGRMGISEERLALDGLPAIMRGPLLMAGGAQLGIGASAPPPELESAEELLLLAAAAAAARR